jgi:DNA-binding NarL/FixJ family response regulator
MDIQMPDMDGYQATALIRADERHADLPIIAMTAHAVAGYRERCLEMDMNDYVTKPIDPDTLYAVLATWVTPDLARARAEPLPPRGRLLAPARHAPASTCTRRWNGWVATTPCCRSCWPVRARL